MLIADAQVHVWGADTAERPWPPGRAAQAHRATPFGHEELLARMDEAGVDRAVIVPPSWEGDRNDLALEAARLHPDRFAVMGRLAIEDPASRAKVANWKQQPGMLGLRFTFHTPVSRPWLTDGTADWLWPAAEKAGVPIMFLPPGQLAVADRIAERHPGLRLVIDHLGRQMGTKDEAAFGDLDELLKLARRPNVAVKATGLMGYSTEPYPWPTLQGHVKRVVDAFGPQRVFWGTDITRLSCTYREAIDFFTKEMDFLSQQDLEWIMGRGLCEWLGWRVPEPAQTIE